MPKLGPIVDCNVHLWDQRDNPVFWLTDRTRVRDLIGNYDSLPDVYTLDDYERETAGFDVRGIVTGIVSLGDPAADGFGELVERLRMNPLVRSVRVRLAAGLTQGARDEPALLDQPAVMEISR